MILFLFQSGTKKIWKTGKKLYISKKDNLENNLREVFPFSQFIRTSEVCFAVQILLCNNSLESLDIS